MISRVHLLAATVTAVVLAGAGCSEDAGSAGGFCDTASRNDAAFASLDLADASAMGHFRELAAGAPDPVRGDLLVLADGGERLVEDPAGLLADEDELARIDAAIGGVDSYLEDTCGIEVPERPDSLFAPTEDR